MKPASLEDLRPEPGKFFLRKLDREFTIHPITMADELWIQRTFGQGDEANEKLKSDEGVARLTYQLLSPEDKAIFKAIERPTFDDNGNEIRERVGGWQLLMESIQGLPERVLLQRALLRTKGISYPMLDEAIEEALKKKGLQAESLTSLAGRESSTSFPPNTDGPGTTSGPAPQELSGSPSERFPRVDPTPEPLRPLSTASGSSGRRRPEGEVSLPRKRRRVPKGL